jgi:hypothetical protein
MSPMISNNIIAFSTQGAGIHCKDVGTVPVLSCNDILGNAGGDAICGTDAGDNMSMDPQSCGTLGSGNYGLQSDSPCTPANPTCGQVGALDVDCGAVSTEQRSWGAIKFLYQR